MISMNVNVKVQQDNLHQLAEQLKALSSLHVYVGVPEKDASRGGENINNAELAYIHTNGVKAAADIYKIEKGSPLYKIPPRPMIDPVITKNIDLIDKKFQDLSKEALSNPQTNIKDGLEKIGMIVRDKIKDNFTDPNNGWAPNSDATIAQKGSDKPLIDTGALRNSIDYIVDK